MIHKLESDRVNASREEAQAAGAQAAGRSRPCPWRTLPLFLLLVPVVLPGQSPPPEGATISVDVNLVVLPVTVRDRRGEFVAGLGKEDFQIFEDGRLQTIRLFQHEDMPVSVGLIVDNSTSMIRKRKDVTAAALAFVRSSNPRDEMFVVNFNERASLGLPPGEPFTAAASELEKALNGVPAHGMTALYDAIEEGLVHVKQASREKKVLIAISDGGDNASRHTLPEVLADVERANIMIYTIGLYDEFDEDRNPGVLKRIARATGGEAFLPHESSEVVPICERIAADIRHQYTIGYVPSDPTLDGAYRRIRVTATRPHGGKLFVRAREGYIAAPQKTGAGSQGPGAGGAP